MRRRFCATIRKPAFSIRALMAPVRLRAVASGLMIENVRSIAIVSPRAGTAATQVKRAYREQAGRQQAASTRYRRSGRVARFSDAAGAARVLHNPDLKMN